MFGLVLSFFALLGFLFVLTKLGSLIIWFGSGVMRGVPYLIGSIVFAIREIVLTVFQIALHFVTSVRNLIAMTGEPRLVRSQVPPRAAEDICSRMSLPHLVFKSWVAPTCALGVFLFFGGVIQREWTRFGERASSTTAAKIPFTIAAPQGLTLTSDQSNPMPTVTQPTWITQEAVTQSEVTMVVLKSQLWATEAEAETELTAQAAQILRADFRERHHDFPDPHTAQSLSADHIMEAAVKNRFSETTEQNFGKYSGQMHRVWWLLELSPEVRTSLYPDWKLASVQNRALIVSALIGLITLLLTATELSSVMRKSHSFSAWQKTLVPIASIMGWAIPGVCLAGFLMR